MGTICDRQMMLPNIQSGCEDYSLCAWLRLFLTAGYLLVGLLTDVSGEKFLSAATLCTALATLLNPVLFGDSAYYTINMCLFYLCPGASLLKTRSMGSRFIITQCRTKMK